MHPKYRVIVWVTKKDSIVRLRVPVREQMGEFAQFMLVNSRSVVWRAGCTSGPQASQQLLHRLGVDEVCDGHGRGLPCGEHQWPTWCLHLLFRCRAWQNDHGK